MCYMWRNWRSFNVNLHQKGPLLDHPPSIQSSGEPCVIGVWEVLAATWIDARSYAASLEDLADMPSLWDAVGRFQPVSSYVSLGNNINVSLETTEHLASALQWSEVALKIFATDRRPWLC